MTSAMTALHARTYHGPDGRTVVRFVAEPLLDAEDIALATVGVTRQDADPGNRDGNTDPDTVVGTTAVRAVGFPAWPILTDPANARHALNLVGDLEWARRAVHSRPKEVAARFEHLTVDLTASAPHFVPTLLEELTRLFAAAGQGALARRMFSLARETERAHDVPVDPERHRAMVVEFAGLGAVGAKELTAEIKAASGRFDSPQQALDHVLSLITELADAGTPPTAAMLRDTRKIAKAAGLPEEESDRRGLAAVLGTKGFPHAAEGFFTTCGEELASFLTDHPDRADAFATRRPGNLGTEDFLTVLDTCGWLTRHRTDATAHARWLVDLIVDGAAVDWSARLVAEIYHARTGFTDLGPLPLVPQWPTLHPTVLDALCAVDAVTDTATEVRWTALDRWARNPHGDLDALAAHPTLGLRAMTSLVAREVTDLTTHLDVLLTHSGTRTMLTRWLDHLADRRRQHVGALPDLGHDLEKKLPHLADPRLAALTPDALRTLLTVDPVASFTAAVRAGLLVEYAWPALEASVVRLERETGQSAQVFGTFPQVAVLAADRIEIIDGGRVLRSLTAPTAGKDVRQVLTVAGDTGPADSVLVLFLDGYDAYLWWDGDTAATPTGSAVTVGGAGSLPVPAGRLVGDAVLTGHGDLPEDRWATVIAVPGAGTFTVNDSGENLRRRDPVSGTGEDTVTVTGVTEILDATGLTGLLAQALPTGTDPRDLWRRISWESSYALPVPDTASVDNPLGAVDGTLVCVHGDASGTQVWNAHRQVTPLGVFENPGTVIAGTTGESWRLGYSARRTGDGTALSFSSDAAGHRHVLERLPQLAWCVPGYRNRDASARMRGYTTGLAVEVIDALAPDPERKVPVPDHYDLSRETTTTVNSTPEAPAVGVLAGQLGIDRGAGADLTLPVALSHLAADCAALSATADALRTQVFPDGATGQDAAPTVTADLSDETVQWLSPWPLWATAAMWTSATNDLLTWTGSGSEADHPVGPAETTGPTRPTGVTFESHGAHGSVAHLAGRERMLLNHWASPLIPRGTVPALIALAREMVDAGLWCGPWVSVTVELTAALADGFPEQELTWHDVGAPVLSLHGARFRPDFNDNRMTVLVRRADLPDLTVPVVTGPPDTALGMDRAEFLTGLDALTTASTATTDPALDEDAVTRMRQATGLSTPAVRMLLGGFHDPRYFDVTARTRYGLSPKQADLAGEQVFSLGQGIVEAVIAGAGDVPEPTVRLTDREWEQAAARSVGNYRTAAQALTGLLYRGETIDPAGATAALLTLVTGMALSDERRPAVADLLRTVNTAATEYMTEPHHRTRLGEMDLGTSVTDPGFRGNVTPENQTVRVGAEGLLDDLIADLDTVHPDLPGCPLDPRNCVPDLVAEVTTTLHLSESAATYYLQLLALADPTDAHVRAWNSWKKKDIDTAAGELVAAGLVVEAKRTGAGRTRFLPGGWLAGRSGITSSRPVQVWTAPLYLLWNDVKARSVIPGCPPHIPVRALFTTAWRRILDGDTPGYETLTTTRHPGEEVTPHDSVHH